MYPSSLFMTFFYLSSKWYMSFRRQNSFPSTFCVFHAYRKEGQKGDCLASGKGGNPSAKGPRNTEGTTTPPQSAALTCVTSRCDAVRRPDLICRLFFNSRIDSIELVQINAPISHEAIQRPSQSRQTQFLESRSA